MISFKDDYSEGAHENILNALLLTNTMQEAGYGLDTYSISAKNKILKLLEGPADIHFITGGTQTNLLAISSFLRAHEACISPESGHIAVHETGAIEHSGHKVITVPTSNGKLDISSINRVINDHSDEHMVKPRLVYISNPTEIGSIYSKQELKELYEYTQEHNLLLYADGARLGAALATGQISLKDMYQFTDSFFIGGTKNGALLGEALVIKNNHLKTDFRYITKQKGALLAKGRLLGLQFDVLFTDNLLINLGKKAVGLAQKMQRTLKTYNIPFLIDSPTNQIFPILSNDLIEQLSQEYAFYVWEKIDNDSSAIRLVTSWATLESSVDTLLESVRIRL